jgi:hypothetical protein
MPHTRRIRTALAAGLLTLAGLCLSASMARAGENQGRLSLSAGLDFPTAYYFRGILQQDGGFIAQPYGDATFKLYEGGQEFNSMDATVGIWTSWQADGLPTRQDPEAWYEADLYGGFSWGFVDTLNVGGSYIAYTSPNDSFSTVQELDWKFSFDDSALLGAFALSPYILLAAEVAGQADGGSGKGVYMELGIEPGLTLIKSEKYPVTLSVPLKIGLSLKDYYEDPITGDDSTFGYFDGGIVVSVPLGFIPPDFGAWNFYASAHFLAFGSSLKTFNNGDDFKALGIFGFSLAY